MFDAAARVAKAGWPVIVDAVFDRPVDRAEIEKAARAAGIAFDGVWLDVDLAQRRRRVAERVNDVSDATADVVESQATKDTAQISWTRVDASGDVATIALRLPLSA
jgi:predicted kinase